MFFKNPHAAAWLMAKYKASAAKKDVQVMSLSKSAGGKDKKRQILLSFESRKANSLPSSGCSCPVFKDFNITCELPNLAEMDQVPGTEVNMPEVERTS